MINSMTGFGQADFNDGNYTILVEIKSVNNKHFNLKVNAPDFLAHLERTIEKQIRTRISRGSVHAYIKFRVHQDKPRISFNTQIIDGYFNNLKTVAKDLSGTLDDEQQNILKRPGLKELLGLPGVMEELPTEYNMDEIFSTLQPVIEEALHKCCQMRSVEGELLGKNIVAIHNDVEKEVKHIVERAPQVIQEYRDKLCKRVNTLLEGMELKIKENDLLKEIAIYSDRSDIREEIDRLRAHLEQVQSTLKDTAIKGRKLDFLSQELLREANTIGSKANDIEIAKSVVNLKTSIEQLKEQVQNIE